MRRAFTLVELLIVIIIIAVLASIAVPKFANSTRASKEAALKTKLRTIRSAMDRVKSDTGYLPWSLASLASPVNTEFLDDSSGTKVVTTSDWNGPYLDPSSAGVSGAGLLDPVSGTNFGYSKSAGISKRVTSSATGNAINGTAYSSW